MSKKILAGVIGDPIAHSKSPKLHGEWLRRYEIDGSYDAIHVTRENLKSALDELQARGFAGINVTIPHKETILEFADIVTDRAALMGAANTIRFTDSGQIHADNTDGYGFVENVKQNSSWRPETGPAHVIGAGGAARAVISALISEGVQEIRVTNRTRTRAEMLKNEFGAKITVVDWHKMEDSLRSVALLINTTSLGMEGEPKLTLDLGRLKSDTIVTDLVYAPLKTELLLNAAAKGCEIVDGLGMLIHQAVPGFERWFGVRPEVDEALRRLLLTNG